MSDLSNPFKLSIPEGANFSDANAVNVERMSLSVGSNLLLNNTDLKISRNRRYGLLGPNGKGKTSLLRQIADGHIAIDEFWDKLLVEQEVKSSERSVVDEVLSADKSTNELVEEETRLIEEMESLNVETQMKRIETLNLRLEQISDELEARETSSSESRVRKILVGLGFSMKKQDSPVSTFSGGWRMRIALAKALFMKPMLLMLDEPTNHLDLEAVIWLDHYLSEEYPHSVIVVSHDVDFLDAVCTDIIALTNQKLMYFRGGYSSYKKMRAQQLVKERKDYDRYESALKSAKTPNEKEAVMKKYDYPTKPPAEYSVKLQIRGVGGGRESDRHGMRIGLDNVYFYYGDEPKDWLLEKVDFGMDCTSRVALVGANGSGKTTFLKLLTNEIEPIEGECHFPRGIRVETFNQHFHEHLPLNESPVEYIRSCSANANKSSNQRPIRNDGDARAVLGQFGLSSDAHVRPIGSLSGGQKARVAFAGLTIRSPHILVLDEPTNHLDIETVDALIDALCHFDGGIIVVSHDVKLITAIECDLYVCENRRILKHDGDFYDYRDEVLIALAKRQEELEQRFAIKNGDNSVLKNRKTAPKVDIPKQKDIDDSNDEKLDKKKKKKKDKKSKGASEESVASSEEQNEKKKKKKDKAMAKLGFGKKK